MATSREWAQVIAQAWLDEEFKELLEKDPVAALKQHGIKTDVVRPVPPRPSELNDEHLEVIAVDEAIINFMKRSPIFVNADCSFVGAFGIKDTSLIKKELNLAIERASII